MTPLIQALHVFVPVAWLAAAMANAFSYGIDPGPRLARVRIATSALALLLHPILIASSWQHLGQAPIHDAWSTLSWTALFLAVLHFSTTRFIDNAGTGTILLAVVASLQILASAFGAREPVPGPGRPGAFFVFHVLTSVVGTAALVLSGMNGGLYLMLFRRMNSNRIDAFARGLPSLETLARLTRRAALAGFLALTISINFGIGWAHYTDVADFQYGDPWVLFILILWVHFGVVAFSRKIPGLSARRASFAAAAGLSLFLMLFLVTLMPEITFHWDR